MVFMAQHEPINNLQITWSKSLCKKIAFEDWLDCQLIRPIMDRSLSLSKISVLPPGTALLAILLAGFSELAT